jgi:hypothetical protein
MMFFPLDTSNFIVIKGFINSFIKDNNFKRDVCQETGFEDECRKIESVWGVRPLGSKPVFVRA